MTHHAQTAVARIAVHIIKISSGAAQRPAASSTWGGSSPLAVHARLAPLELARTTYHRVIPGRSAPAIDIIRLVLGSPGTSAIMGKKTKSDPPPASAGGGLRYAKTNYSCRVPSFS
jgi:hypothetical protein